VDLAGKVGFWKALCSNSDDLAAEEPLQILACSELTRELKIKSEKRNSDEERQKQNCETVKL
jgi:hypothetical protein